MKFANRRIVSRIDWIIKKNHLLVWMFCVLQMRDIKIKSIQYYCTLSYRRRRLFIVTLCRRTNHFICDEWTKWSRPVMINKTTRKIRNDNYEHATLSPAYNQLVYVCVCQCAVLNVRLIHYANGVFICLVKCLRRDSNSTDAEGKTSTMYAH